jgi:restriction system protein
MNFGTLRVVPSFAKFLTGCIFFLLAASVQAQIQVCIDPHGIKTYTDKPCASIGGATSRVIENINPNGKECRALSDSVKSILGNIAQLDRGMSGGYGSISLATILKTSQERYARQCGRKAPSNPTAQPRTAPMTAPVQTASGLAPATIERADAVSAQPWQSAHAPHLAPSRAQQARQTHTDAQRELQRSSVLLGVIKALWWLPFMFAILVFLAYLQSPKGKGALWEFFVACIIRCSLNKEYRLLNNVTLPADSGTTQVDHIIVSIYGVFVIEDKNFGGAIYGSEHRKDWTQVLGRLKNSFQNPLHQNYKHTKTIAELTELTNEKIHSLVAFSGRATFKTPMPDNVTTGADFIRFIDSKRQPLMSAQEVIWITSKIEHARLKPSRATDKIHVDNVREIRKR